MERWNAVGWHLADQAGREGGMGSKKRQVHRLVVACERAADRVPCRPAGLRESLSVRLRCHVYLPRPQNGQAHPRTYLTFPRWMFLLLRREREPAVGPLFRPAGQKAGVLRRNAESL